MSLFRCQEIWSVSVAPSDELDGDSMLVDYLNGEPCIWVGSHDGYIRAYHPQPHAHQPADHLLYEMQCDAPVLQLARGDFVQLESGRELAVLHPTSLRVYRVVRSTSDNNPVSLTILYQHTLVRPPYSIITGTFGGNHTRDLICVQSLDCILTFFRQEGEIINCNLEKMLMPSRMAYIRNIDGFIYQDADYNLVCYEYQHLITNSNFTWAHNIGESLTDIQVVYREDSVEVVVLTERSLYGMTPDGSIHWVKRLQVPSVCFHSYQPISASNVMTLLCMEGGRIEVHQANKLMWAAQADFTALAVSLVEITHQMPHIIALTNHGQVVVMYLGTQPWLYLMPSQTEPGITDVTQAEQELNRLHEIVSQNHMTECNEDPLTASIHVDNDVITATLSVITPLTNVQAVLEVSAPLSVTAEDGGSSRVVASVVKSETVKWRVHVTNTGPVSSLEARLYVIYTAPGLGVRVQQRMTYLPWKIALQQCPPAAANDDVQAKLTLTTANTPVLPGAIFGSDPAAQAAAVKSIKGGSQVTLLAGRTSRRYRVQADAMEDICIVVQQLTDTPGVELSFPGPLPLPQYIQHLQTLHSLVTRRRQLSTSLSQLTAQYRTIQKKILASIKDVHETCTNLYHALDLTFTSMCGCVDELNELAVEVQAVSCRLSAMCRLLTSLIKVMSVSKEDATTLTHIFMPYIHHGEEQGWLETTQAVVSLLLRTSLAKSSRDQNKTSQVSLDPVTDADLPRLVKMITSVLDRVTRGTSLLERNEFQPHKESQATVPSTKEWKDQVSSGTKLTRPLPSAVPAKHLLPTTHIRVSENINKKVEVVENVTTIQQAVPVLSSSESLAPPQEPQSIWDIDIDDVVI